MIHDLLSDGVTRCLQHLLNSPKKNYVVTTQLKTNEKRSFSVLYMVIKNPPPLPSSTRTDGIFISNDNQAVEGQVNILA